MAIAMRLQTMVRAMAREAGTEAECKTYIKLLGELFSPLQDWMSANSVAGIYEQALLHNHISGFAVQFKLQSEERHWSGCREMDGRGHLPDLLQFLNESISNSPFM